MVGTSKLSSADVTDGSALRRTPHGHALHKASVAHLVVIGSVEEQDDSSSLPFLYPFQCVEESETPSVNENMPLSGYYT